MACIPPLRKREKIYVKVISEFDATGFMVPKSITWDDGRTFPIERVTDFRPAAAFQQNHGGDCYTVIVHGKEKHLFFERASMMFPSRFGRWFVECVSG